MEGVAGHLALGAGERGQARLRGGPAALHRGDQRDRARRVRGRRERGRGDGLPRRGRRLVVQLADPRRARRALRVRRADALDRVHGDARAGLRRRALRRPARPRGRRARRALAHRQLDQLAQPALQRDARRRGRHQRRAVRDLGHAGRARHRRRRRLRRGERAARPQTCTRSRSSRASAASRARHLAPARARELLEAAAREAVRQRASAPVYDPGAPCTIEVELATPDHADVFRHRANVTLTDARTSRARRTRGGTPGARSTSETPYAASRNAELVREAAGVEGGEGLRGLRAHAGQCATWRPASPLSSEFRRPDPSGPDPRPES